MEGERGNPSNKLGKSVSGKVSNRGKKQRGEKAKRSRQRWEKRSTRWEIDTVALEKARVERVGWCISKSVQKRASRKGSWPGLVNREIAELL